MGLMNKILTETSTPAGDGLLKRALELRRSVETAPPASAGVPDNVPVVQDEKKKPLMRYSLRAA